MTAEKTIFAKGAMWKYEIAINITKVITT